MAQPKTVKVKTAKVHGNQGGYKLINKSDMAATDELFVETSAKVTKTKTAT